ncbi:MAG TPA: UDP-N-acetylmuramate:L-alanyl-gamma-D-glutamyl-meso-diaminopimelate ligase [Gammaproteobacteria bacterium]|nr:UDP-N-acetylmuramate:L-alanyl-gamma-D-glutamyl-meso-diaminopimelate ligase [Gammaproteobacteria bacterium]
MHVHILGICGTFMGGIAALAREAGHRVTGSDANVYPPMSEQLAALGIELIEGWDPAQLDPAPDVVVVGNALSRGNPCVEHMLAQGLRYTSGPQWLAEHILHGRWTVAVAGTHGKTTTTAMVARILEHAGLAPGFLVGGIPVDFGVSARLGASRFFVVEADEYDTAFFDKRSKFVHYGPRTAILNNLEYDHADIFPDLLSIQRQFHHLVRTVPGNGLIVANARDANLAATLAMGCWTPVERFSDEGETDWTAVDVAPDGSSFTVLHGGCEMGRVRWKLAGRHNVQNALAAIAAVRHVGVPPAVAIEALGSFGGVKRRLELRGEARGIRVYDDFAHHPTAIRLTLEGIRRRERQGRIIAVFEPRSNTMKLGVHRDDLAPAFAAADYVFLYRPENLGWDIGEVVQALDGRATAADSIAGLVERLRAFLHPGDHVVIMSNGGFGGIHDKLLDALAHDEARRRETGGAGV